MRAFAGVLFFTLAVPSVAQAPSQDSILIGDFGDVRLSLGQSKDSTLRRLHESFDVGDWEGGQFSILSKQGATAGVYGVISFKDGRLSSVTKFWNINGPDRGVAVVQAIRGAMSSFGPLGQECSVKTFNNQEPKMEKSGAVVSCGKRQVQIFTNRWAFSTGSGEGVVVNEVLSSEP